MHCDTASQFVDVHVEEASSSVPLWMMPALSY